MKNNSEKNYLIANFMFNLGRTLPHAILTTILLTKQLDVNAISYIAASYMLGVLLFEIPLGVIADLIEEKRLYLISISLIFIAYFIVLTRTNLLAMLIAWFIYGISAASMSGTLDLYFIKRYKEKELDFKHFMVKNNYSILISSLIGGLIGSLIYLKIAINIYYVALILFIITFLIIKFGVKQTNVKKPPVNQQIISKFILEFKNQIKNNQMLRAIIVQIVIFEIVLQTYFQFWQVALLTKKIEIKYFGFIYLFAQILSILASSIFKKIKVTNKLELMLISVTCGSYLVFLNIENYLILLISFIFFLGAFNIYLNSIMYQLNTYGKNNNLSSLVSFTSSLCKIIGMIILIGIGITSKYINLTVIITILTLITGIVSVSIIWYKKYLNFS